LSYKGHKWLLPKEYAVKEILVKESLSGVMRFYCQGEEITAIQISESVISLADQLKKKQSAVVAAPHSVPTIPVNTRSLNDDLVNGPFVEQGS
jgi:hypothetical protein